MAESVKAVRLDVRSRPWKDLSIHFAKLLKIDSKKEEG